MTTLEIIGGRILRLDGLVAYADTFVLQSGPALGTPTIMWVFLCFVGIIVGAVGSAVVHRLSNPVLKYRLLYLGVVVPYGMVAYGLLALLDFGTAVRTALVPGVGGIVAALFAEFATTLAAGVAVLATYGPTIRGIRAVRDIELTTTAALGQMARYVLGVAALLSVVATALNRSSGVGGILLIFVGFVVLLLGASPWLIAALRSTRSLTDAEMERITRLREQAGLSVRDVRVLETGDAATPTAQVRGPPGYRRLFVSDAFLDRFDDETAGALLAVQAGRIREHVHAWRVGTLLGAGVLLSVVFGVVSLFPAVIAGFGALLIGLWLTRRRIRDADDYALERTSVEALVSAFERYAAAHGMEPSRRRFPNPLSANVALGDRIDRFREAQSSSTD